MSVAIVQIFFVLVACALIVLILLQHSKGADMGVSFGAGASATVFGARGSASFMYKATRLLALVFFLISLLLGYLENKNAHSGGILSNSVFVEKKSDVGLDIPSQSGHNGKPASGTTIPIPKN